MYSLDSMTAKQINTYWHIAIIFDAYRLCESGIWTRRRG